MPLLFACTPPNDETSGDSGTEPPPVATVDSFVIDNSIDVTNFSMTFFTNVETNGSLAPYEINGDTINPFVEILFTTQEYFQQSNDEGWDEESCFVIGTFSEDFALPLAPSDMFDVEPPGPGLPTPPIAHAYEFALDVLTEATDYVDSADVQDQLCMNKLDESVWGKNGADLLEAFDGARVGVAWATMSLDLLERLRGGTNWDRSIEPSLAATYWAFNDPEGNFLAQELGITRAFERVPGTPTVVVTNNNLQQVDISAALENGDLFPEVHIRSFDFWFPNLSAFDLSNLKDNAPTGGPRETVLIDFETPAALRGFEGASVGIVADPEDAANMVGEITRSDTASAAGGAVVSMCDNEGIATLPMSSATSALSLRVLSPDANIPVMLKLESTLDPAAFVQTTATTTAKGAWEVLEFDFAPGNETGSPPIDFDAVYDRVVVFPNFGTDGATAGAQTFYIDDLTFLNARFDNVCPEPKTWPMTFDDAYTTYQTTPFGGTACALADDPDAAGNRVVEVVKAAGAETGAGCTVGHTGTDQVAPEWGKGMTTVSVRVRSPRGGVPVLLKLENAADNTQPVTEVVMGTTAANAWETLTFDFSTGTPAFDPAATYDKISVFPDFGAMGADETFHFDDFTIVAP